MANDLDFIKKRLGAIGRIPDSRDYRIATASPAIIAQLPEEYDGLKEYHSAEWYDQSEVGSCTGWSAGIVLDSELKIMGESFNSSKGWIYWRGRHYAGMDDYYTDGGTVVGTLKTLNKEGAAPESCAKTDIKTPFKIYPCDEAYTLAKNHGIGSYHSVTMTSKYDLMAAIYGLTNTAPYKMPDGTQGKLYLCTAFTVYQNMMDALHNGGVVPAQPTDGTGSLGGHASVIRGWKMVDGKLHWVNTNSWSKDVGDKGTFYLPVDGWKFWEAWTIHPGAPTSEPDPPTALPKLVPKTAYATTKGFISMADSTTEPETRREWYVDGALSGTEQYLQKTFTTCGVHNFKLKIFDETANGMGELSQDIEIPELDPAPTPTPTPTPSTCPRGNAAAKILNTIPATLGRRGRFYYLNPDGDN